MVNETHKPPGDNNAALNERLAASNRQLQEMQEEHRQLLLEMETLRQRAAELSRLNVMQQQRRQQLETAVQEQQQLAEEQQQESELTEPNEVEDASTVEQQVETKTAATDVGERQVEIPLATQTAAEAAESEVATETKTTEETAKAEETKTAAETETAADSEETTAAYLQDKLAEIARLKSQFKRVQNMIDTTKIIEEHITNKEAQDIVLKAAKQQQQLLQQQQQLQQKVTTTSSTTGNNSPTPTSTIAQERDESEELLNTMLHMFTDFTADLRGQAESLRAERDRIRLLKEDIIKRKQQK